MSSLVTSTEQGILTGLFDNVFQTFTRNVVVWKTPIKVPIPASQQPSGLFGFGNAPEEQQYQYTPVSGIYPAVIRYYERTKIGEADLLKETNVFIPEGAVRIKVRPDAQAFIESGITDKFSFDGRDFVFEGISEARIFLGSTYTMYQLKPKI